MKNMDRVIFGSVLLIGLGFGLNAQACTTAGWLGGFVDGGGSAVVGSPPAISRLQEFCALKVTGQSHVQSDWANDARYIGRFYLFDGLQGTGGLTIFRAFSAEDGTGALFHINFDGSQFTFDTSDAGGELSAGVASIGGWNLVEFDWDSVGGTMKYWVNADASADPETGSINAGAGTVDSVQLGAPTGMGNHTGMMIFDTFESHRTTPVGAVLVGDANNDGNINSGDIIGVINEFFSAENLAIGAPDCNGDGNVNSGDIICIINAFFNPA
jgi:hypothetical protein